MFHRTEAHLVGRQTRYLNEQARDPGLVAIVRDQDGIEHQWRVRRVRRKDNELQGLTVTGEWLPIVHMWNG